MTGALAPTALADLVPVEASDAERSAAILTAAGYRILPLAEPIGPWEILATDACGLVLVATCRGGWPADLGIRYGHPASFPPGTKRLLHRWEPGGALPADVLTP